MAKKQYYLSVKSITALARNKRLRAAGYSVSAVIKNGSTSSINNNSSSGGGSDIDLSKYVKFSDEATESKSGVLSTTDKTFIDALADIFIVIDPDEGGEIQEGQVSLDDLSAFFKGLLFDGMAFTNAVEALGDKETRDWNNSEALQIWELNGFTALFGGAKILMNYVNSQHGGLMLSADKVYLDLLNKYIVESNPSNAYLIPLDLLSRFFGEFLNNNVAFTSDPSVLGEREAKGDYETFQLWDFDAGNPLFDAVRIRMNYASDTHGGLMYPSDKEKLDLLDPYSYLEKEDFLYGGNWAVNAPDASDGYGTTDSVNVSFRRDGTTLICLFSIKSATDEEAGVMSAEDKTHLDAVYSAWQNSAGFLTSTEKANYDETYNKVSAGYIMSKEDKEHLDELYNAWKNGEL